MERSGHLDASDGQFEDQIEDQNSRKKRVTWLDDETEILVHLYTEEIAQSPIKGKYRKLNSYVNITKQLKEVGYNRTADQVRTKIKQLQREYYAARKGTERDRLDCYMYEELDELFRTENGSKDGTCEYFEAEETTSHNGDDLKDDTQQSVDTLPFYGSPVSLGKLENMNFQKRPQFTQLKKDKQERVDTTHGDDGEEEVTDIKKIDLISFVTEQLDKQRQHQQAITKTFTEAMTTQFTQFSNLITNLTQQMYAHNEQKKPNKKAENIVEMVPLELEKIAEPPLKKQRKNIPKKK